MKKLILSALILTLIWSCKKDPKTTNQDDTTQESTETLTLEVDESGFPEALQKIFDAHGGLATWEAFESMYFEIERSDYQEKYTVNLKDRKSVIRYKDHVLGFDGENVWVKDLGTESFKSNPNYLYNLMYYFYGMPFIMHNDGINFKEAVPLKYDDVEYPGIVFSFKEGSGKKVDDEYIIYYDPTSYQMEWLAFTVQAVVNTSVKQYSLIKYHDWTEVTGLIMPSIMQWHLYNDGAVGDQINEMFFVKAQLTEESPPDDFFALPEGATITPKE